MMSLGKAAALSALVLAGADLAEEPIRGVGSPDLDAFGLFERSGNVPTRAMEVIQESYNVQLQLVYKDQDGDGDKEWCLETDRIELHRPSDDNPQTVRFNVGQNDFIQRSQSDPGVLVMGLRNPITGARLYGTFTYPDHTLGERATITVTFNEVDPRVVTQQIGTQHYTSPQRPNLTVPANLP